MEDVDISTLDDAAFSSSWADRQDVRHGGLVLNVDVGRSPNMCVSNYIVHVVGVLTFTDDTRACRGYQLMAWPQQACVCVYSRVVVSVI